MKKTHVGGPRDSTLQVLKCKIRNLFAGRTLDSNLKFCQQIDCYLELFKPPMKLNRKDTGISPWIHDQAVASFLPLASGITITMLNMPSQMDGDMLSKSFVGLCWSDGDMLLQPYILCLQSLLDRNPEESHSWALTDFTYPQPWAWATNLFFGGHRSRWVGNPRCFFSTKVDIIV